MIKTVPMNGNIRVEVTKETITKGGIVIPENGNKRNKCTVVEVAKDVKNLKAGDEIIATTYEIAYVSSTEAATFVNIKDVLCVVKGEYEKGAGSLC